MGVIIINCGNPCKPMNTAQFVVFPVWNPLWKYAKIWENYFMGKLCLDFLQRGIAASKVWLVPPMSREFQSCHENLGGIGKFDLIGQRCNKMGTILCQHFSDWGHPGHPSANGHHNKNSVRHPKMGPCWPSWPADIVHGSRVSMVVGQHVAQNNLFGPVIDLPGMSIEVLFTSQNGDV